MDKLQGKVAVITGGSSGIGLAAAKLFVAEGAYVFISGRRQAELDKAVKEIGGNVSAVQADVTKQGDLERLFAEVKSQKGRIDVLCCNAGIAENAKLVDITEQHYNQIMDVNVKGLLFSVQKSLPLFTQAGGSIVLMGSVAASKANGRLSVYCASKAAVRALARTLALELRARNIRVNVLAPGPVATELYSNASGHSEAAEQFMAAMTIMRRLGRADEIATAAVFLASEDSSYMTGAELAVDGGLAQY